MNDNPLTMRSMKTIKTIILLLVALMLGTGCTNNGDIGSLYGSWRVENITVDGQDLPLDENTTTSFNFQNNIVMVKQSDVHHSYQYVVGTWQQTGANLTLTFHYHDDGTEPSEGMYAPPFWVGITEAITTFTMTLDNNIMTLERTTAQGAKQKITLKKFTL